MIEIINSNSLHIPLADESVSMVCTSPPYWSLRNYNVDGQLGLEETPELFVENLVNVFREVWRVLHPSGVVFLNLGDSYCGSGGPGGDYDRMYSNKNDKETCALKGKNASKKVVGLKPKDLVGIPWRVAFALQADGWWLRSDIIWHKPNPMPESVTDRPTKAHEYVFLLSKSKKYFYDADAVREPYLPQSYDRNKYLKQTSTSPGRHKPGNTDERYKDLHIQPLNPSGRNRRTVWTIATRPYPGSHFATFPPALVEPCIKAGTSEKGMCPECGSQWERVVEKETVWRERPNQYTSYRDINGQPDQRKSGINTITTGWKPSCDCCQICNQYGQLHGEQPCKPYEPVPSIVLDIFAGSGTSGIVSRKLGRSFIGLDLSWSYLHDQARKRLSMDALDEWENGVKADGDNTDLPLFNF
jgi:DNA modification methylase